MLGAAWRGSAAAAALVAALALAGTPAADGDPLPAAPSAPPPLAAPVAAPVAAPARQLTAVKALERQALAELNAIRARHHLVPLRPSTELAAAAEEHSRQMGALGYFSHNSADGSAFWKRLQRYYGSRGYPFWSVGENLLWWSPEVDAARTLQLWMESPGHREILLRARWREIGLAAVHVTAAPGVFHGLDVTIVTADFGVRR